MIILDSSTLDHVGILADHEVEGLRLGYLGSKYDKDAQDTLSRLKARKQFLLCNCSSDLTNPPMLGVRKLKAGGLILANLPGKSNHSLECLFSYDKAKSEDTGDKQEFKPIVQSRDNGYLEIREDDIKTLYRKLLHNSNLNSVNPHYWSIQNFEDSLITGARLSPELVRFGVSSKIHFGFQSLKRAKELLFDLDHGDYQICFNLISGFDNRAINLSFKEESPYWHQAGKLIVNTITSRGPYIATTVLTRFKENIVILGTYIEPVLSKWMPIPIKSQCHRELAFGLVGKGGIFDDEKFNNDKCTLNIPLFEIESPVGEEFIHPDMIVRSAKGVAVIGSPTKLQRGSYNEHGALVWFRELPYIPEKKKLEIDKLMRLVASII